MPTLISNCVDTNSLAAAFVKAQKYAADNDFKMQKSREDVNKMMAACSAHAPPDRPEVKFEDAGKTMTATVGKAKKSVLVIATKEQPTTDTRPMLKEIETMLREIDHKVGTHAVAMASKATDIDTFINIGQEGCNALYVLVKELKAKGTAGDKLGDFKANAHVVTFAKTINENAARAEAGIAQWDGLAKQAGQIQALIGTIEARIKTVGAIMVKAEQVNELKAVHAALANMKKGLAELVAQDIPRGTGFLKLDANTAVADIELKANMSFKATLKALEERQKKGADTARVLRQQHTGEALKHIQALAHMV